MQTFTNGGLQPLATLRQLQIHGYAILTRYLSTCGTNSYSKSLFADYYYILQFNKYVNCRIVGLGAQRSITNVIVHCTPSTLDSLFSEM